MRQITRIFLEGERPTLNSVLLCKWGKVLSDLHMPRLNWTSSMENVWFCLIFIVEFTLVIKSRNFDFESHWNALIFFDKKIYYVRFEYVPWKNIWFCFISIVWVHFSHKTEKFRFLKSLKYFNVSFLSKKMMPDLNMSCQTMSDLV